MLTAGKRKQAQFTRLTIPDQHSVAIHEQHADDIDK